MKESKIIVIVGTHFAGKTALCTELVNFLSSRGFSVGMIEEVVRQLPSRFINEQASIEAQSWVLGRQVEEEAELKNRYLIGITDRGVIDNFAYWERAAENSHLNESLIEEKKQEVFSYSQRNYDIIFFNQPFEVKEIEDDNYRSLDPQWRQEMHDRVSRVLKKFQENYNIPIFPLAGSKEEVFKQAKEILENYLLHK